MVTISAQVDYIQGHLRWGHYEDQLTDEEYENFKGMSESERREYLKDNGKLVVDSYEVDDVGDLIEDVQISEP